MNITFTVGASTAVDRAVADRTYAVNGMAIGAATERGWLNVEYITKEKSIELKTGYVQRLSEGDRRFIFAKWIDCENRFEGRAVRDRCTTDLRTNMKVTREEAALIRNEGVTVGWPPLRPLREPVADIIAEGLKLCRDDVVTIR